MATLIGSVVAGMCFVPLLAHADSQAACWEAEEFAFDIEPGLDCVYADPYSVEEHAGFWVFNDCDFDIVACVDGECDHPIGASTGKLLGAFTPQPGPVAGEVEFLGDDARYVLTATAVLERRCGGGPMRSGDSSGEPDDAYPRESESPGRGDGPYEGEEGEEDEAAETEELTSACSIRGGGLGGTSAFLLVILATTRRRS